MIQVTIFSGREGPFRYDGTWYFTVFGGCELTKPTIAREIMIARQREQAAARARQAQDAGDEWGRVAYRTGSTAASKPFFFTLFGATSIKYPTLAEELVDLQQLLRSGELTLEDWDRAMFALTKLEQSCSSFTLFGGFDEGELPDEDEEINSLAMQCHLGNISEPSREVLQAGIGLKDSDRRAVLHRAVTATA
jgi:hypothetical protein